MARRAEGSIINAVSGILLFLGHVYSKVRLLIWVRCIYAFGDQFGERVGYQG